MVWRLFCTLTLVGMAWWGWPILTDMRQFQNPIVHILLMTLVCSVWGAAILVIWLSLLIQLVRELFLRTVEEVLLVLLPAKKVSSAVRPAAPKPQPSPLLRETEAFRRERNHIDAAYQEAVNKVAREAERRGLK